MLAHLHGGTLRLWTSWTTSISTFRLRHLLRYPKRLHPSSSLWVCFYPTADQGSVKAHTRQQAHRSPFAHRGHIPDTRPPASHSCFGGTRESAGRLRSELACVRGGRGCPLEDRLCAKAALRSMCTGEAGGDGGAGPSSARGWVGGWLAGQKEQGEAFRGGGGSGETGTRACGHRGLEGKEGRRGGRARPERRGWEKGSEPRRAGRARLTRKRGR